uniref:1-Cys peroxiredoxin n=2 Tax=Lygus hesperus TaxID=30085 RepID=A0A0A9X160_LYGHE
MVNLGDVIPDFSAKTTQGDIKFHEWVGDSWCILFSHPNAFTPVCTTELGRVAQLVPEFQSRNVKVIGCSCDAVPVQDKWIEDISSYAELPAMDFPFPIIADESRSLAVTLGMIDPEEKDKDGLPVTCRAVFVIDPSKKLRLLILYPATTGRNFDELLRVVESLQLTDAKKVATPSDWKSGDPVMIQPSVTDEEAKELFPLGFTTTKVPSGKGYIRLTPQPQLD